MITETSPQPQLLPQDLPTTDVPQWISSRTATALVAAGALRDQIKSADTATATTELLEWWNRLEIALSNIGSIAGTFTELHPDSDVRSEGERSLQALEKFSTDLSLDADLCATFLAASDAGLEPDAARLLDQIRRDFRRSGVDRDAPTRARITEISDRMVTLGQDFSRNIRDDVRSITLPAGGLAGMPKDWITSHEVTDGAITITTDYPDAVPFFTFATDAGARDQLRHAYLNRGWPVNDSVLKELFALRSEYARLVGYENWADYDAEVKMIGSAAGVKGFIDSVSNAARPSAERDFQVLLERVRVDDPSATTVSLSDKDFYAELVRKEQFGVDAAHVRTYFQFPLVLDGMLRATERLFGLTLTQVTATTWHEDVLAYDVCLDEGEAGGPELIGRAYLDLHPREGKYGHAAQFDLASGVTGVQLAEGVLGCNFGTGLLNHSEVVTLFHEFGHLVHHLLAGRGRYVRFSGVATEWDFVEAPSQMLEEWAWSPQVLAAFAVNEAGEPISVELVAQMRAAEDFGKGFDALTQMFYAALSYTYHTEDVEDLTARLAQLQAEYAKFEYLPGTHMMASFGHLDGYSSAYYTYMWSLVIAKDMFSQFDSGDMFAPEVAARYRDGVLTPGGSRDAADLVKDFLGRDYTIEAFNTWLEH